MVFVRKRIKKVQVPAQPHLSRLPQILLQRPSYFFKVAKTKKFILARLKGKTTEEAKKEAGLSNTVSSTQLLSTPLAQALLDELVIKKIPNDDVSNRLKEWWDARKEQIQYDKKGQRVVYDLGEDFEKRKYAMDKRLALGGYAGGELPENRQAQVVTNITFVTVDKPKEVIDVEGK